MTVNMFDVSGKVQLNKKSCKKLKQQDKAVQKHEEVIFLCIPFFKYQIMVFTFNKYCCAIYGFEEPILRSL